MGTKLFVGIIKIYQYLLSPSLGSQCRFTPTCSTYAISAIKLHGPAIGGYLMTKRICRCHPFSLGGEDLVPARPYSIFKNFNK
jgi:hypothetical protein